MLSPIALMVPLDKNMQCHLGFCRSDGAWDQEMMNRNGMARVRCMLNVPSPQRE